MSKQQGGGSPEPILVGGLVATSLKGTCGGGRGVSTETNYVEKKRWALANMPYRSGISVLLTEKKESRRREHLGKPESGWEWKTTRHS